MSTYPSTAQGDPFGDDEEKFPPPPQLVQQIRIYTEFYEISALEYAKLISAPSKSNNHGKLRNSLLAKAKKGEAKLISNHSIIARSGERATTESVREFLYTAELPVSDGLPLKMPDNSGDNIFPSNPATPTAFETRNLGVTLEVEPILAENRKIVDLYINLEMVKHVGDHVLSTADFPYAKITDSQPIFYTNRLRTAVTMIDGEFLLASTFSPDIDGKPDHSRKILCFVRAEVLTVAKQ